MQKINVWCLGGVFVFCIRLLLQRHRYQQSVYLCRRFARLGRSSLFRCVLHLGLHAQQQLLKIKQHALLKAQLVLNAAAREQTQAQQQLQQAAAAAAEKETQEPYNSNTINPKP